MDSNIIGKKIISVRRMTDVEMKKEGWLLDDPPPVLILDNGVKLYPSRDPEGNGPGAIFGATPDNQFLTLI